MRLRIGTLLQGGKYKMEEVLGQGGFGITYLAVQSGLGCRVAIKESLIREHSNRYSNTSHDFDYLHWEKTFFLQNSNIYTLYGKT